MEQTNANNEIKGSEGEYPLADDSEWNDKGDDIDMLQKEVGARNDEHTSSDGDSSCGCTSLNSYGE